MGEGLPFDCAEDDKDYTLDTTVVLSDEEEEEDTIFGYDQQEQQHLQELEKARNEKAKKIQDGEKALHEYMAMWQLSKSSSSSKEKSRAAALNERLNEIKKQIEDSESNEEEAELRLLEASAKKKTHEIRLAIKEKEIRSVQRKVATAECVDLAFVLDGTSSMVHHIAAVKDNMQKIVTHVLRTNANLKIRLAVVVYRDLEYKQRFDVLDFVTSLHAFENFVSKIEAVTGEKGRQGPRDTPEDMAGGIQIANNQLSWSQPTKIVFLIADSPCHGVEFHSLEDDNHPRGTPGIDILKEVRALQTNKDPYGTTSVYFGRITERTDKMIQRFAESGISFEEVDVKNAKIMVQVLTTSIRNSIFKTITASTGKRNGALSFGPMDFDLKSVMEGKSLGASRGPGARLKRYSVIPKLPSVEEWENQPAVEVKVYRNESVKSTSDLKKPLPVGLLRRFRNLLAPSRANSEEKTDIMILRRAAGPFAEGGIRIAYYGQLAKNEDDLDLQKSNVVMKSFKHIGEGLNDRKQYLRQMEVSNLASFLAKEYNKSRPLTCAAVHILPVCVVEESDEANEKLGSRRFCVEAPLPTDGTKFTRYSNNTGYWAEDALDETLLRFTEYTYQVTEGYLLVSDLQGVRAGSGDFYLTDPVVHCTDTLRFGHTNLGLDFMTKCLATTRLHLKENGWDSRGSSHALPVNSVTIGNIRKIRSLQKAK